MKTKPEIQIVIFEILIKEEFLLYLDCATYIKKKEAKNYFNVLDEFLIKEKLGWIDLALDIKNIILLQNQRQSDQMLVSGLKEFETFVHFKRVCYQQTLIEAKQLYETGIQKESDNESNFLEYIREAAELGYPEAQTYLAECYQFGEKVKIKDEELARSWYMKAAILGDEFAQFRVGMCWQYWFGIDWSGIDCSEAFKWYKRAALRGCAIAQSSLAGLYIEGLGVDKNEKEAFGWYKLAVENGDKSYYQLGECYEKGIGVEINKSKAIEMYKKAARYDDIFGLWAKQRLKELDK